MYTLFLVALIDDQFRVVKTFYGVSPKDTYREVIKWKTSPRNDYGDDLLVWSETELRMYETRQYGVLL